MTEPITLNYHLQAYRADQSEKMAYSKKVKHVTHTD